MYDNLKPKTILPEEAKKLVALNKRQSLTIIPMKCCVLLMKGAMDDDFLMSLARKYKDSSWISPKQNQITFKFLLDASTRDLFKNVVIFNKEELLANFASKIYSSGITLIRRGERDRMLRGLAFIRIGYDSIYLSHHLSEDGAVALDLMALESKVKAAVERGFKLWTNLCLTQSSDPNDKFKIVLENNFTVYQEEDGKYTITDPKGNEYFETSQIIELLYTINSLIPAVESEAVGDETFALKA